MQSTYHVHFGAGRLGLGLVVPLLRHYAKGVPLAIFQRPRQQENPNEETICESVQLVVNDDTVMDFKCVTSRTSHPDVRELLDQRVPLFVSTSDIDTLRAILSRTSSFSTSVGPCGFEDTIQGLEIAQASKYEGPMRKVYLFENDAERFKKQIEERLGQQFEIIQVICDRICTQREICKDQLRVVCEGFSGMAVIYPSRKSTETHTPFKKRSQGMNSSPSVSRRSFPTLILTRTHEEAHYYYQRKLSLLNGTHFTMAVLAYHVLQSKGHERSSWASRMLSEWKSDPQNQRLIRSTIQGRILRLLYDTPSDVLQLVHGTDDMAVIYSMTMEYVKTTMRRIENTPDTLGRVLNLNDQKNILIKKERYLGSVSAWLNKAKIAAEATEIVGASQKEITEIFEQLSYKFDSVSLNAATVEA